MVGAGREGDPGCRSLDIQIHSRHSPNHDVVHTVQPGSGSRQRLLVRTAAACSAALCAVVVLVLGAGGSGGKGKVEDLTVFASGRGCNDCFPVPSAAVAMHAYRVADAQDQLQMHVLYDSANGQAGPGLFNRAVGAPLYYSAVPSLTPPSQVEVARPSQVEVAPAEGTGYRLMWVPDQVGPAEHHEGQIMGGTEAASASSEAKKETPSNAMKEIGGRDELPFVPVPEKATAGTGHAKWLPDDCNGDDAGETFCEKHWRWTEQYPHRELVTSQFPHDHYVPTKTYPYIRGPYYHHVVDGKQQAYADHGGHWTWVSDDDDKIQDHFTPPADKYQPPPYGQAG